MKVFVRAFDDMKRILRSKSTVELTDGAKIRDLILKPGAKVEGEGTPLYVLTSSKIQLWWSS